MTDGLKDTHREAIIGVIAANDRVERAVLFGSRATGTNSVSSDVDIALFGDRLTLTDQGRLAAALDEIPMAQSVDLILYAAIDNRRLLEHIHRNGVEWYRRIGETIALQEKPAPISDDWRTVELGDCVVVNDPTYSPTEAWPFVNYLDTGNITENRVLEIQNLIAGRDRLPSRARRKVLPGDIVYSTVRPNLRHFGLLKRVPTHFLASTGFAVMRGRHDVAHTDFIYWFLTQEKVVKHLQTIAEHSTSAYPSIRPADIQSLSLDLPPLQEQRAIAHILGTLDDKIELNRRMNATLEAMARALFRSWFVDFDPVQAKMGGRDTGLPKEIADLFPGRLVDSEQGEIPEGWSLRRVRDVCERIENGGTPKRAEPRYWNGEVDWFKTAELHDEPLLASEERISDEGLRESSCKIWPTGTILIALYASPTVGRLGILTTPATANQACSALVANKDVGNQFLFYSLLLSREHLQSIAVGAAQQNISQQVVREHRIVVPLSQLTGAFESVVSDLHRKKTACLRESHALGALRAALLPKLVSGEVRVTGLEPASGHDDHPARVGIHGA